MQKHLTIITSLFLMVGTIGCINIAVDGQDYDDAIITKAQSKLIFRESQDLPNNTQISIALIEDGIPKKYGIKRENDTIYTFDNHRSVFEIGSISKVFTATLLADFVLNQKVNLDDLIRDFMAVPLKDNIDITFKQLANHTSGLPKMPSNWNVFSIDLQTPYKDYDEVKLEGYMAKELKIAQKPGSRFEYSNVGVGLLGFVLAEIEKTTYEDLLQTRIFSKYQMTGSTTNRDMVSNLLVRGLNSEGKVIPNWDLNVLVGAGGILSSVSDLSRFAIAQFNSSNEALKLTRMSTYRGYINGDKMNVGLGWIIKEKPDKEWIWHNGGTSGYTAAMQINIESRNAVIILSNVSGISRKRVNIDSLCDRLMGTLKNE